MRNNLLKFTQPRIITAVKSQENSIANKHDYFTASVTTPPSKNNNLSKNSVVSENNAINSKRHAEDYADYHGAEHESRRQPQLLTTLASDANLKDSSHDESSELVTVITSLNKRKNLRTAAFKLAGPSLKMRLATIYLQIKHELAPLAIEIKLSFFTQVLSTTPTIQQLEIIEQLCQKSITSASKLSALAEFIFELNDTFTPTQLAFISIHTGVNFPQTINHLTQHKACIRYLIAEIKRNLNLSDISIQKLLHRTHDNVFSVLIQVYAMQNIIKRISTTARLSPNMIITILERSANNIGEAILALNDFPEYILEITKYNNLTQQEISQLLRCSGTSIYPKILAILSELNPHKYHKNFKFPKIPIAAEEYLNLDHLTMLLPQIKQQADMEKHMKSDLN